jgi:multidrug efflux system outer membrane protein
LPQLSLTGLLGFESTNTRSIFNWQNFIASLGAAALTPVFNGGRVRAGVDQARATYRGSLAQYEKTVLTAYQEVEDQVAALRILSGEAQSETDAVDDAKRAEEIAMNRYKAGLVGYLDVLVAQTTLLSNGWPRRSMGSAWLPPLFWSNLWVAGGSECQLRRT